MRSISSRYVTPLYFGFFSVHEQTAGQSVTHAYETGCKPGSWTWSGGPYLEVRILKSFSIFTGFSLYRIDRLKLFQSSFWRVWHSRHRFKADYCQLNWISSRSYPLVSSTGASWPRKICRQRSRSWQLLSMALMILIRRWRLGLGYDMIEIQRV